VKTGKIVGVGSTINHEATTVASHSSGVGFSWQQRERQTAAKKGEERYLFFVDYFKSLPYLGWRKK
jgi:hypothetical protein